MGYGSGTSEGNGCKTVHYGIGWTVGTVGTVKIYGLQNQKIISISIYIRYIDIEV